MSPVPHWLLLQALLCSPHPPVPGQHAVLRARDRAGAPIAGLAITVRDEQRGTLVALPATDAQGEAPWTPVATGLHVAAADWRATATAAPVELLLAIEVPAPFYGPAARVVMALAAVVVIGLNVRALRRARRG